MSLWRIWFYWDRDKMIRFGMHNFGMQDKRMPLELFTTETFLSGCVCSRKDWRVHLRMLSCLSRTRSFTLGYPHFRNGHFKVLKVR